MLRGVLHKLVGDGLKIVSWPEYVNCWFISLRRFWRASQKQDKHTQTTQTCPVIAFPYNSTKCSKYILVNKFKWTHFFFFLKTGGSLHFKISQTYTIKNTPISRAPQPTLLKEEMATWRVGIWHHENEKENTSLEGDYGKVLCFLGCPYLNINNVSLKVNHLHLSNETNSEVIKRLHFFFDIIGPPLSSLTFNGNLLTRGGLVNLSRCWAC